MKRTRGDDYASHLLAAQAEALDSVSRRPAPPPPGASHKRLEAYSAAVREWEADRQLDRDARALQLSTEADAKAAAAAAARALDALAREGALREEAAFAGSALLRAPPCAALAAWLDAGTDLAAAGKPMEEHTIRKQSEHLADDAKKQIMTEVR